ncbi:hypothetical protein SLEP1_g56345 [Rubroshorea leprosula]|uniref:Uncharacterized protein n=1 Tax=Rubroshorea leprosula TaxID=152421 RepID=A0AAV5MKE0_9ROSI|nr:hypothetical protein SLEP1_g56345 [Rubroshorea leprosula]
MSWVAGFDETQICWVPSNPALLVARTQPCWVRRNPATGLAGFVETQQLWVLRDQQGWVSTNLAFARTQPC